MSDEKDKISSLKQSFKYIYKHASAKQFCEAQNKSKKSKISLSVNSSPLNKQKFKKNENGLFRRELGNFFHTVKKLKSVQTKRQSIIAIDSTSQNKIFIPLVQHSYSSTNNLNKVCANEDQPKSMFTIKNRNLSFIKKLLKEKTKSKTSVFYLHDSQDDISIEPNVSVDFIFV
jgi:hypothetical protein